MHLYEFFGGESEAEGHTVKEFAVTLAPGVDSDGIHGPIELI
jgi:hypothetical protein